MKDRYGKVKVSRSFIMQQPEELQAIFALAKFLPIRIDYDVYPDVVEFYGMSPMFEGESLGHLVRTYQFKVHQTGQNGELTSVEVLKSE